MPKVNVKNERVKRSFYRWLKGADGCCESTVNNIENAILLWQEFSKDEDFDLYNGDKAIDFKRWLSERQFRDKPISIVTYHAYLRYLRKFFVWISREPGHRRRIKPNSLAYLKVTEKEARMATQSAPRNYPSLDYVQKVINSIQPKTEIDRRDRALIAFTLLSGMRDSAIASLPIGCFDRDKLVIQQNPRKGVNTKFSKLIPSTIFRFDENMLDFVLEWARALDEKGFGSQDPLFPRSKLEQGADNLAFEAASEVEPVFWQGTGRIREIFKRRAREAELSYYPPHTFRHLATQLAVKACRGGEEMKAISQNFGHEHIATTISVYGNYDPARLTDIIKGMEFSGKTKPTLEEKVDEVLLALKNKVL